jgi:hypothetical protein
MGHHRHAGRKEGGKFIKRAMKERTRSFYFSAPDIDDRRQKQGRD